MTKKDYNAIAGAFRQARLSVFTDETDPRWIVAFQEGKIAALDALEKEFVRILRADNARFDADRFREAVK